ncbi:cobyrinate a,c-diamide synthase [Neptunicoccus cionae]|uniref:Hydrogenobyrinate a,c-diamide synthase n=1 Tax=Neptunicoccus cionae TaxID=2035344 RepID=A0A916VRP8_9RHOB|nr:cobyrinate a,c-diamide synthase [Amylibacter cionae]GGA23242.1 cobyrinic acid a,c-diamide synthase [Amylibacter cionae]
MRGLILSAPGSASGKTTLTLGILRALKLRGIAVRSAKSGPDYIDPRFHAAASGTECLNLDAWAMTPDRIRSLASGPDPLLIEGAMGLFDGAPPDGKGATADLARILNLPVVLILDVSHQAQSVAAVAKGFATLDPNVKIAGIILNKVGSPRHERMVRLALAPLNIPVLGAVHRQTGLQTPSRHLGLVQAVEHPDLEAFLDQAAHIASDAIDLDALLQLTAPLAVPSTTAQALPPPAQRLTIAADAAFAFAYPHLLQDWRKQGAELAFFSPLADEAPPPADLVFLPGGYPELHAGKLSANAQFINGLRAAPAVYGECGGYMMLGDGLVDASGNRHQMAGLLRLETSFASRKLHLGYRNLTPHGGPWASPLRAHEFHYATTLSATGDPLFDATDAESTALSPMGLRAGSVTGSFAHIIDRAAS